jgi:hypothetical protein
VPPILQMQMALKVCYELASNSLRLSVA